MSTAKKAYLDMKYDSTTKLGQNWAAYIEVDDAYAWDPATEIEGVTKEQIVCETEVMWTKNYAGSKSSPGMGLKFISISEEALAMVEKFILVNQS